MATADSGHLRVVGDDEGYWQLWESFARHLRAEGRSPHTLRIYRRGVLVLHDWLAERVRPVDPVQVTREDIRGLLADLQARQAPATVKTVFTALAAWFNWLEREGELERSPMYRMSTPRVPEKPMYVLGPEELGRLLKVVSGPEFEDRRDLAMFRLFIDTGLRRQEMANLMLEDLDLETQLVRVTIKGGDTTMAPFGTKAARDLDRYLRLRTRHRQAGTTIERGRDQELLHPLWLSAYGGLSGDGIYAVLRRRAVQAGLDPEKIHPHTFRHSFAHSLKASGASDEDVQRLGRWRDSKMVRKYGAGLAQQRAWETHRRLSPGDRV
jgi:site-specific recombinase XerD